jgi:hypothetical protein
MNQQESAGKPSDSIRLQYQICRKVPEITCPDWTDPQSPLPAAGSRVVIQLAQNTNAKPNANTRTLRPDKCLVASSMSPALRPVCPRNTGANAATTRNGLTPLRPFDIIQFEIRGKPDFV